MKKRFLFVSIALFALFSCKKNVVQPTPQGLKLDIDTRNCADVVVYKYGTYKSDTITFDITQFASFLDTSKKVVTKQLGNLAGIQPLVQITSYENYAPISYCPGIIPMGYNPIEKERWSSVSGELKMKVVEKLPLGAPIDMYVVNFQLTNVTLQSQKGNKIFIPFLLIEKAFVGGFLPPTKNP